MRESSRNLKLFCFLLIFIIIPMSSSILDSNSSNNVKSVNITINQTNDFPVLYIRYGFEENDFLTESELFLQSDAQNDYVNLFFPIRNGNAFVVNQSLTESVELFQNVSSGSNPCDILKDIDAKMFLSDFNSSLGGIVALASDYFFEKNYLVNYSGFMCSDSKSVIVRVSNYYKKTSAHELGHQFRLCDEYKLNYFHIQDNSTSGDCFNGDLDEGYNSSTGEWGDGNLDQRCINASIDLGFNKGCPVENESLIKNLFSQKYEISSNDNLVNLYGHESIFDQTEKWINKETYTHLISAMSGPQKYNCTSNPVVVVILNLFKVNNSLQVQPSNFYVSLTGGCFEVQNSTFQGDLLVQTKNKSGSVVSNFSKAPSFELIGDDGTTLEMNQSSLIITMPFINVSSFSFLVNGIENASRNVSANIPNISLISPNGGQIFTNPFNITWNASDLDNDTLAYAVLISDDNGTSWSTLTFDLNTTYYEVSNAWFNYGTSYKVKVLATDGVNTGSDVSDSNFTIVPPPSVKVDSIDELYSNEGYKIYEVAIENNGGQDLSKLQWCFNTGLTTINSTINSTLAINEVMTLLFAYNYSSGGWMNVSLLAFDNNKSVNDSLSELFFVGDLMVGGFKELFGNVTNRVFEFIMSNQGNNTLTNVRWTVKTGDNNNFSSSSAINLSAYDSAYVIFGYNFSNTGSYNMTVNVSDSFNPDNRSLSVFIPDIVINNFIILSQSDSIVNFSFGLQNMLNKLVNASYKLNTGVQNITNSSIILSPNQSINFSVPANYTSYGNFSVILNASDNYSHSSLASMNVSVNELLVSGLQKLYSSGTLATFEFIINNLFSANRTFSWSFDTNNTAGIIKSTSSITLASYENTSILFQHNFSSTGNYLVTAKANTSKANYSASLDISLS